MGPRHDAVRRRQGVPRVGECHFEIPQVVGVQVVVEQNVIDVPEVHVTSQSPMVAEPEAKSVGVEGFNITLIE